VGWDAYASTGLDVTTAYGVHVDPFAAERLFISYTDIGLFRSEDGGKGWIASSRGIPRQWRNTTYWLETDPQARGLMWAATSGTHDLPRPKMWRTRRIPDYRGGICISTNGGKSWSVSSRGLADSAVTHVLLDPRSPVGARTLYATSFGHGVYQSKDGGASWMLKPVGIQEKNPLAWRLALAQDKVLYLVIARRREDGEQGGAGDGALYRSSDGAEHWQRLPLPQRVNGPTGIVVDRDDPRRLYLSAWGWRTPPTDIIGGVFLSEDGGKTWRQTLRQGNFVYDVTVDSRNSQVMYASGFDGCAWRSGDRGLSWSRLKGYNFKWGHRVIPDERAPDRVFITTFGGGVWYGPATGDPASQEDILSPLLRP
jgi:photosystem II stability/assembly factor-like uncharacterized protein